MPIFCFRNGTNPSKIQKRRLINYPASRASLTQGDSAGSQGIHKQVVRTLWLGEILDTNTKSVHSVNDKHGKKIYEICPVYGVPLKMRTLLCYLVTLNLNNTS